MINTLTISEKSLIPQLPSHFQPIVAAKYSTPIKSIGDRSLAEGLTEMLIVTNAELGLKLEGNNDVITFLRETLMKDLRAPKFQTVSLDLIKLFVSNGVRGQYGTFKNQMNIVNIQNIHYWINEGLKSEAYKKAIMEYNELLKKEVEPKSIMSKMMFSKSACVKAFEHYKLIKTPPNAAFAYYDILNELIGVEYKGFKTLLTDPEKRKAIHAETLEFYTKQMSAVQRKESKRNNLTLAEAIMNEIATEFKGSKGFENLLKERYLLAFFDQLINQNKNLEL